MINEALVVKEIIKKGIINDIEVEQFGDVIVHYDKLLNYKYSFNTKTGLIIVYTGTMAVFALWNMKGYFDTIPWEIEEAAIIDGCNLFQLCIRVVLPIIKPVVMTIVIFNVMILQFNFL